MTSAPEPLRAQRSRPGQPRSMPARALLLAIAIPMVLLPACSDSAATFVLPEPPTVEVQVVHGDRARTMDVLQGSSVAMVLEGARIEPRDGQVVSAVEGRPLGPNGDEARLELDGRPTRATAIVEEPSTIAVVDGTDTVEATETARRPLAPSGLPDALQHIHHPGEAGVEEVVAGVRSDEVVSVSTLVEPVPARRATGKVLALTFDDGPSPTWTPQVLDILAAKGVVATFCVVGTLVEAYPDLVARIAAEGHLLCNHTVTHAEGLESEPAEVIDAEVSGGHDLIADAIGSPPPFYRPPGGSLGPPIYEAAAEHEEQVLYWSIDTLDWKRPPTDELVISTVTQFEPGGIILLHDGGGDRTATVEALPAIIDFAQALGYTFTAPLSRRPQVG